MNQVSCDSCKFNERLYSDGYVFKDWSGQYKGDVKDLPKIPDQTKFWTYQICKKNTKGLKFINLDGKCSAFSKA